jgi:glycosyltransferase involved in cell wall biosynthesis
LGSIYNNFYDKNKLEIETIVIDNNSSDNTAAVIENFIKINLFGIMKISDLLRVATRESKNLQGII